MAGIAQPFLSQIELGKNRASEETLEKLAQALEVSVSDLTGTGMRAGMEKEAPRGERENLRVLQIPFYGEKPEGDVEQWLAVPWNEGKMGPAGKDVETRPFAMSVEENFVVVNPIRKISVGEPCLIFFPEHDEFLTAPVWLRKDGGMTLQDVSGNLHFSKEDIQRGEIMIMGPVVLEIGFPGRRKEKMYV